MVGSARNREKLALGLRKAGYYARALTKRIELSKATGASLASEILWENGRIGLYLMIRGQLSSLSRNIDDSTFEATLQNVLSVLQEAKLENTL